MVAVTVVIPTRKRNAGIAAAEGDPIAFVDDDVDAPPTWLASLVDGVKRHAEAGCFGGPIRLRLEGRPPRMCGRERLGETELDLGEREIPVDEVYGANLLVRGWALRVAGEFDERLPLYGDETEWLRRYRRAGGTIWYVPAAWVWHRRTAEQLGFGTLLCARFRRGISHAKYRGAIGDRPRIAAALVGIGINLGHAAKRRCPMGVLTAATIAGQLWESVRCRG